MIFSLYMNWTNANHSSIYTSFPSDSYVDSSDKELFNSQSASHQHPDTPPDARHGSNYFEIRSEKQVATAGRYRTLPAARRGAGQVGECNPSQTGCSLTTKIATAKRFGGLDRWH